MKYLFVLFFLLVSMCMIAQKFQKGHFEIRTGLGISFYNVNTNENRDDTENLVNASSVVLPVYAGYSISDEMSFGLVLQNDRFIVDRDSLNIYGSMFHVGPSGVFRVINKKNDTFDINVSAGFSGLNWTYRATNNGISAKGTFFIAGVSYTHFWTNSLGYYFALGYIHVNYSEIENKNYEIITVNYGAENFEIDLSGVRFSTGLCLKF